MHISGHKTPAVFDRYDIVSERDLADAAAKIEAGQPFEFGHTLGILEDGYDSPAPLKKPETPQ